MNKVQTHLQYILIITIHGSMNDIQLDTTAYVGVSTSAHVGYRGGFCVARASSSGLWSPSEIGRKLTRPASSQIMAIVTTATLRVTQRPYLWGECLLMLFYVILAFERGFGRMVVEKYTMRM